MDLYKITTVTVQQLLLIDPQLGLKYYSWFQDNLNDDRLLNLMFSSIEARFHLSGCVNLQNHRVRSYCMFYCDISVPLTSYCVDNIL